MAVFNVLLVQVIHHSRVKEIFKTYKEYPCVITIMRDYALDQHVDSQTQCSECYSPHPKSRCNNKIKTNMEIKGTDKKQNGKVKNSSSSQ